MNKVSETYKRYFMMNKLGYINFNIKNFNEFQSFYNKNLSSIDLSLNCEYWNIIFEKDRKIRDKSLPCYKNYYKAVECDKRNLKVICVKTGETFNSIKEASLKLKIKCESISKCCRGKSISTNKMHFIFADESLRNKYKPKQRKQNIKSNHCKKVKCVELNKEFESVIDASRQLNIVPHGIYACCNNKQETCGGFHWKSLD